MTDNAGRQALLPGVTQDRAKSVNATQTRNHRPLVPQKGIPIGENWRVGADAYNVTLFKRVKSRTGKADRWETVGYYSTLGSALVGLVHQGIRDTELESIQAVQDKIAELEHDILKMAAGK